MAVRTTEQIAPEHVAHLLGQLNKLTADQPTKIEEAIITSRALTASLMSWVSARHLIGANAHMAAQFSETHPAVATVVLGLQQREAVKAFTVHPEVAEQLDALFPGERAEAERLNRVHVEPGFKLDLRDLA